MKTLAQLADNYDDAYLSIKKQLNNLQRETSAVLMAEFPDRQWILDRADELRTSLGSEAVEVNVISMGKQVTIVSQPDKSTLSVSIPDTDSLCVLTVGVDGPLSVTSISESTFLQGHDVNNVWESWASAPVHINGFAAGSVCGLESRPREWTPENEASLEEIASKIGTAVEKWARE